MQEKGPKIYATGRHAIWWLVLLMLFCGQLGAQIRQPTNRAEVWPLDESKVIRLALRYNQDINIARQKIRVDDWDIERARAEFDPALFSKATYGSSVERSLSMGSDLLTMFVVPDSEALELERLKVILGVQKKCLTGTVVAVAFDMEKLRTKGDNPWPELLGNDYLPLLDPSYQTRLSLQVTQPLLKNFGITYNSAKMRLAHCMRTIAVYKLEDTMRKSIGTVLTTYWDLVLAYHGQALTKQSLTLARRLHHDNQLLYKVGKATMLDVLQVEVKVMDLQRRLLQTDQVIADLADKLKSLILSPQQSFHTKVKLVPRQEPIYRFHPVDLVTALRTALKKRPDYQQLLQKVAMLRIQVSRSHNQLYPKLDFTGQAGLLGRDDGFGNSIDDLFSGKSYFWQIGLALEIPLGNRYARSTYAKSRAKLKQALMEQAQAQMNIELELRVRTRTLQTIAQQIKVAQAACQVAQRQLETVRLKLKLGEATPRQLLQAQEDLAKARANQLQAVVAHNKAMVALQQAQGTLLEFYQWGRQP